MRICIVGPSFPLRGGISHHTTLLYRHLRERHETVLYSFSRQYPRWLFPGKTDKDNSRIMLEEKGAEAILDSMNPLSWYRTYRKIKSFRPDLVIFPWWTFFWTPQFTFLAALIHWKTGARVLFICHNVVEHESNALANWCTRFVLGRGDLYLVHSSEDLSNLRSMLPGAIVRQAYHPCYDEFPRTGLSRESARKRLGVEGDVILFFGFVRQYKGLSYLIDALPGVLANRDVTLMIVGEFWKDKERYLEKIDELDINAAVRIVDDYVPNEELEKYFAAADLLVLPYTSATGSGVVQLSFGFNLPVLVTSVGALPEVVDDGVTGMIVPPRDPDAISEKIVRFFEQGQRTTMMERIETEKKRFSWAGVVEEIERLGCSEANGDI